MDADGGEEEDPAVVAARLITAEEVTVLDGHTSEAGAYTRSLISST
jgi:hypothetical protein